MKFHNFFYNLNGFRENYKKAFNTLSLACYQTVGFIVDVIDPNTFRLCINKYGNYTCLVVQLNNYYCDDIRQEGIGKITKKRIELAKEQLKYKLEGKLVQVRFKNNKELEWMVCLEDGDNITEFMIKNKLTIPLGANNVPMLGMLWN